MLKKLSVVLFGKSKEQSVSEDLPGLYSLASVCLLSLRGVTSPVLLPLYTPDIHSTVSHLCYVTRHLSFVSITYL